MLINVRLPGSSREKAAMLAALCAESGLVPVPEGVVDLVLDLPLSEETRNTIETVRSEIETVRRDIRIHANFASN